MGQRKLLKYFALILLSAINILFFSCKEAEHPYFNVFGDLEWAYASQESTAQEVLENPESFNFQYVKEIGRKALFDSVGYKGNYLWFKVVFTLPEQYKNKDLAFYEAFMKFADKVYLNGNFVGEYGRFPPDELSAGDISHIYFLPKALLNQDSENVLLIKMWCHGDSDISEKMFIGDYEYLKNRDDITKFHLSGTYMFWEGGFIVICILYMILFFGQRKKLEYLYFAILNLMTCFFSFTLFGPLLPFYQNYGVPYLVFQKYFVCCSFYIACYCMSTFVDYFMNNTVYKVPVIIRSVMLAVQIILTIAAPDYNALYRLTWPMLIMSYAGGQVAHYHFLRNMFGKDKEKRRNAHILMFGFVPFFITIGADIIIKVVHNNPTYPFTSYFGWIIVTITYQVVLSVRYARTIRTNEYLNSNLAKEVEVRTQELKIANERLESELLRNHYDMEMASIVQKRTFQNPTNSFMGWDIAVCYEPLSEVSGDMYDFYNVGHMLDGFSLFDVSGHGIAASLITMLSKNIIYNCFKESRTKTVNASDIMEQINTEIIDAKGNAENYMTGLMFQISEFEGAEASCMIQFANGGHPHPILYSANERKSSTLLSANAVNQYGAIGFKDIDVSFQNISFRMYVDDILVCYTDGLTEALSPDGKQFGKENLMKIIELHHNDSAAEIVWAIKACLENFTSGKEREDDLTFVVLKREHPDDFLEEI